MIRAALLPLLMLAACAAGPAGEWPSLALRPGEMQPLVARPAAAGKAGGGAAVTPAPAPAVQDAATRVASLERDLTAFEKRLRAQLSETATAATKSGADAEATKQLELTRLDRLGSQAGDLRERFDSLAGDLARQAAAGGDVSAALARVGTGINQVEALRAEQAAAYTAARR